MATQKYNSPESRHSSPERRGRQLRRTLTVLRILSDGRVHEWRQLAERCGVTDRTIRRDVAALDEAGFAIEPDTLDGLQGAVQLVNPSNVRPIVHPQEAR